MQRIADETIRQVKEVSDIVGFIGQYLPLKRRGRNYIGLCPFHSEKTPSFTVSAEKRIYHCFGCHASGDMISFAQEIDNLTFYEAIEVIANFANIQVIKEESGPNAKRHNIQKQDALNCLKEVLPLFQKELNQSQAVLNYCKKRGLSDESISEFELGYLSSTKAVIQYFNSKNISEDQLIQAGLLTKNEHGHYCRFIERLIFPIKDFQNRVIAFGARNLDPQSNRAKYVNSEESSIFNKRKCLYGLNSAKKHIKEQDLCILVEGYMDVIICHQFGFKNVIACMGTALTYEQVALIKRLTNNVVLMLDQDEAGLTATEKSYEQLKKYDMTVSVAQQNQEKDAADLLTQEGEEAFKDAIINANPALVFLFNRIAKHLDKTNIEAVARCVNAIVPYIKMENDEVIRQHYAKQFAEALGVQSKIILGKLMNIEYNAKSFQEFKTIKKERNEKIEESIIFILASDSTLRKTFPIDIIGSFTVPENKALLTDILNKSEVDSELYDALEGEPKKKALTRILFDYSNQFKVSSYKQLLSEFIASFNEKKKKNEISTIKEQIIRFEQEGNEEEVAKLLNQLLELKREHS